MTTQNRRRWTAEEKLHIIEEAPQTPQTVSELCRRHGIAVGQFYAWEKKARQDALEALRAGKRRRKSANPEARLEAMAHCSHYYNYERPHSAVKCLRPADYYRGDPAARLAERERKLAQALEPRRQYWQAYGNAKALQNLSLE